ncbi:MAG TPA: hypothetical protein VLF79_02880 [Candidatus Saccharimonadales bacterium]|nr:hypothetical protein [Candidatus Saccharimonadales bacterium]
MPNREKVPDQNFQLPFGPVLPEVWDGIKTHGIQVTHGHVIQFAVVNPNSPNQNLLSPGVTGRKVGDSMVIVQTESDKPSDSTVEGDELSPQAQLIRDTYKSPLEWKHAIATRFARNAARDLMFFPDPDMN